MSILTNIVEKKSSIKLRTKNDRNICEILTLNIFYPSLCYNFKVYHIFQKLLRIQFIILYCRNLCHSLGMLTAQRLQSTFILFIWSAINCYDNSAFACTAYVWSILDFLKRFWCFIFGRLFEKRGWGAAPSIARIERKSALNSKTVWRGEIQFVCVYYEWLGGTRVRLCARALHRTSADGRVYEMLTSYLFGCFTPLYQLLPSSDVTLVVQWLTYLPTNGKVPGSFLTVATCFII
jgi:hypothetical protein